MSKPTLEYWEAKAQLTKQEAIGGSNVTENLLRMTYAMEQARAIKETMLDFTETEHQHTWECSDIPGLYSCSCGQHAYYDREHGTYHQEETGKEISWHKA